jgi:hypothetical protein
MLISRISLHISSTFIEQGVSFSMSAASGLIAQGLVRCASDWWTPSLLPSRGGVVAPPFQFFDPILWWQSRQGTRTYWPLYAYNFWENMKQGYSRASSSYLEDWLVQR